MEKKILAAFPNFEGVPPKNCRECPECRGIPKEVDWEPYRSSPESWLHLAGREGYLIKCKIHGVRVGEQWTLMS